MDERAQRARAITKALALGLPARVQRVRYGVYVVPSTSREGLTHTVTHVPGDDEALFCDCESRFRPACCHRASVYLAKLEARGLRVTGPARRDHAA